MATRTRATSWCATAARASRSSTLARCERAADDDELFLPFPPPTHTAPPLSGMKLRPPFPIQVKAIDDELRLLLARVVVELAKADTWRDDDPDASLARGDCAEVRARAFGSFETRSSRLGDEAQPPPPPPARLPYLPQVARLVKAIGLRYADGTPDATVAAIAARGRSRRPRARARARSRGWR